MKLLENSPVEFPTPTLEDLPGDRTRTFSLYRNDGMLIYESHFRDCNGFNTIYIDKDDQGECWVTAYSAPHRKELLYFNSVIDAIKWARKRMESQTKGWE